MEFCYIYLLIISIDHTMAELWLSHCSMFVLILVCSIPKFSSVWPLFTHNAVFVRFDFTPQFTPIHSGIRTKMNQEPQVFVKKFYILHYIYITSTLHLTTGLFKETRK